MEEDKANRQAEVCQREVYQLKGSEPEPWDQQGSGAVLEMNEALGAHISWSVFVGSDRIFMALDGGNNIGVGRQATQNNAEASDANDAGEGESPGIAGGLRRLTGSKGQQRAEIIHDELNEDFLAKEIAPYGVRGIEAKVVLEVKERGFNTPAKVVKRLKI